MSVAFPSCPMRTSTALRRGSGSDASEIASAVVKPSSPAPDVGLGFFAGALRDAQRSDHPLLFAWIPAFARTAATRTNAQTRHRCRLARCAEVCLPFRAMPGPAPNI
mgnify:CR=1 FL=1